MTIIPLAAATLSHRAYHLAVGESGHVAALSRNGVASFISPGHLGVRSFQVPFAPKGVALSVDGGAMAVTGENEIAILATATLKQVHGLNDSFQSCHFSSSGMFWTCARVDGASVVLDVWDPTTWMRVARTEVTDPFGDSHFALWPHPDGRSVVTWAAAGQDGQALFWARREGKAIVAERFPGLVSTSWPSFSPTREEFLVISDYQLQRHRYPRGPQSGRMEWPVDGDEIGDVVSYVDADRALVHSNNGRLYLVDLQTMTIAEEVRLQGHEPMPTSEMWPTSAEDHQLCTDMSVFFPLPNNEFVSVHHEPVHPEESHDRILTWRIPDGR
jgi:hypothetical protein